MRNVRSPLVCLVAATLLTAASFAEAPDRIAGAIDSSRMVVLQGRVARSAQPQFDQGRVDPSFQLNRVMLLTVPTLSQQTALTELLAEQQDRKSPNFHKWLTPEQYADRFGLSNKDIKKTTAWLTSQGLSVVSVARGRNWIVFGGTAGQIENAFRTEIHRYNVNGEMHFANATPPSIPTALSGIATGFRGLDNFLPKPRNIKRAVPRSARPNYYDANTGLKDFLAPADLATIYDLTPLYTAGIDGTGEKLVVVGQTTLYLADLVNFRSGFNLPALYSGCTATSGILTACTASSTANFQYVVDGTVNGTTSVPPSQNDLSEADLDLEWSAATAPGAQIIFDIDVELGVFHAYYDAIDNNRAPVISMSYGTCEWNDGGNILVTGGTGFGPDESQLRMASSEGITFLNSSGDSGAAECDPPIGGSDPGGLAIGGLAVSYPASSPQVTGVGGTAIEYPNGFSSTFWTTDDATNNGGTAQNPPLPEIAWNDDVELPVAGYGGTALSWQQNYAIVQSGGGVSNCALQNSTFTTCVSGFSQPTWQSALSVPSAPAVGRFSPDVSLLASPNFPGYIYCTPLEELSQTAPYDGETTSSCGSGGTAGITTAVNGVVSGQNYVVNPSLVGGTSASTPVFAGIMTMLNQYAVTNGLQSTPGLGPINATLYQLAATPASQNAFHQVKTGSNVVYCSGDTPSPAYVTATYLCPGATGTTGTFGFQASNADATTGYNLVTGLGSIDANLLFTAWLGQTAPVTFTLGVGTSTLQVNPGQTGTATINITRPAGFTAAITFTCSETSAPALSASGSVCTVTPSTPTTAASVTVNITTVAPTAQLRRPLGSGGIFYAALLPGFLGIVFTAGSRRRSVRGLRFLSLMTVLGFATLWLGACSSGNSGGGGGSPGTPAGTYNVTVNATATGGTAAPLTVTLVVQ